MGEERRVPRSSAGTEGIVRGLTLLTAAPVVALAVLYSYVLRARLVLGIWPRPYAPDPTALGAPVHLFLARILLAVPFAAAPVGLALAAAGLVLDRREAPRVIRRFLGFALVWGIWFLLMRLDPGEVLAWILD